MFQKDHLFDQQTDLKRNYFWSILKLFPISKTFGKGRLVRLREELVQLNNLKKKNKIKNRLDIKKKVKNIINNFMGINSMVFKPIFLLNNVVFLPLC